MAAVFTACAQMAHRLACIKGKFSEPEWYRIAIGIGRFTENGNRNIHKLSAGHPGYSESACNAKIRQSEAPRRAPAAAPASRYASAVGDSLCVGCPFQGKVYGPIQAALFKDPAPAAAARGEDRRPDHHTELPDPTQAVRRGPRKAPASPSCPRTPMRRGTAEDLRLRPLPAAPAVKHAAGYRAAGVARRAPRGNESKDFTLDADMLYDMRKFVVAIAHQGIYPHKGHLPTLQEYMVAYIAQLQKLADADAQCNHLGWGDDQSFFILPDKVIYPDGTRSSRPSLASVRSAPRKDVHTAAHSNEQVKLMASTTTTNICPTSSSSWPGSPPRSFSRPATME
jgi:hypothetical protein